MFIPTVLEKTSHGERAYDLTSRMLEERIVFLNGEINDQVAMILIQQFLWLEHQDPGKPIMFYINSPGGSVSDGLAIYDAINSITSPVTTVGLGTCASMACTLLAAKYDNKETKRYVLPNTLVMAHQVRGGVGGQASDILIEAKLMRLLNNKLFSFLAKWTNQTLEKIESDADRDYWMTAEEAVAQGYADAIYKP